MDGEDAGLRDRSFFDVVPTEVGAGRFVAGNAGRQTPVVGAFYEYPRARVARAGERKGVRADFKRVVDDGHLRLDVAVG